MENKFISIGKITNFFGIKGEAKVGYTNLAQIKSAKKVYMADSASEELIIEHVRFSKNFAIMKFKGIDDINSLIQYKGQRIFISKEELSKKLEKNEFLIDDLIGCSVFKDSEKIGTVESVASSSGQDILNIKNTLGQIKQVPFVNEFFPDVDIKNKKIIIKPIEGLL